jgi:hypothetical protein
MPTFAEMAPTTVPVIRITARNGESRSLIPANRLHPYFMHAPGWQIYQYCMACASLDQRETLCRYLRDSILPRLVPARNEIEVEQCLIHTDPDRRGEPPLVAAAYASWKNVPGAPIRVSEARLPLDKYVPPGYRLVFSSTTFREKVEFAIRRILRLCSGPAAANCPGSESPHGKVLAPHVTG